MDKQLKELKEQVKTTNLLEVVRDRIVKWRKQHAIIRIDKPTVLKRARSLGYKAKKGFIIVRVRIKKGGLRKTHPKGGRRQRHMGIKKFYPSKGMQLIAEERAARKYQNLEVLNSYWVGKDGQYTWFEIILLDPYNPSIQRDNKINWICDHSQKHRVHRGLTSVGKKMRGLTH